jgi:pyruvate ferredoxin oxidoreductase alpha subunit
MVMRWREKGHKVGLVSLTLYRPFPINEFTDAVSNANTIVVMDRSYSYGSPGAQLYMDVAGALFKRGLTPKVVNVVYGLGGRDFTPDMAEVMLKEVNKGVKDEIWIGLRGE